MAGVPTTEPELVLEKQPTDDSAPVKHTGILLALIRIFVIFGCRSPAPAVHARHPAPVIDHLASGW